MFQDNSLIVSLSVSQWTARKHDKKITDEVKETHNATEDAGRYNKLLIAKKDTEEIAKIAGKAREFHYENTAPWGDNNERLLPAKNYFVYVGEMAKLKEKFDSAITSFFGNYETVVEEAKVRLNGMFNEKDYPTKAEIQSKFGFKISYMPVPTTDFRVSLNDAEVDKIRAKVKEEITNRINAAVADIWDRIKQQLTHMRDKFRDEKGIFRDSLIENLKDLVELLPRLNVTDDLNIAKVCVEMKGLVADPDAIRNNSNLRAQKAQEVDAVLTKFGQFFN